VSTTESRDPASPLAPLLPLRTNESPDQASVFRPPGAINVYGDWYVPLPDDYSAVAPRTPPQEMSVADLAKAMSPILVREGRRYRALEPNEDLARATLGGTLVGTTFGGSVPGTLQPSSDVHPEYLFTNSNPGVPQNGDSRTGDPNGYPYSPIVYLNSPAGTCTGTYVGPNQDTLITAAHCVEFNGATNTSFSFTPAAYGSNGDGSVTDAPWGSFTGCYDFWYPSAWGTSCPGTGDAFTNGCGQFDYAVVDFRRCGNPTIGQTGTMGVSVNVTSLSNVRHDGFPTWYTTSGTPPNQFASPAFTGNPPCGLANNAFQAWPFECGQSGSATVNSFAIESGNIGQSPGDSGGPWYITKSDGFPYVVAINSGYHFYPGCGGTCYRNFARRIDTSVFNFIIAHSRL
jgi:V8-like Glu-specific endopeptidase